MKTSGLLRILIANPPKLIANGLVMPEVAGKMVNFKRGFTSRDDMILMLAELPQDALVYANWQKLSNKELKQMWLK